MLILAASCATNQQVTPKRRPVVKPPPLPVAPHKKIKPVQSPKAAAEKLSLAKPPPPPLPPPPSTNRWLQLTWPKQSANSTVFQRTSLFPSTPWQVYTNAATTNSIFVLMDKASAAHFFTVTAYPLPTEMVGLAWNPNPDPNVSGYNIYYGVASRSYTNKVDASSVTNTWISKLIRGVTYFFTATAYNTLGIESEYCNEVAYTMPTNTAPHGAFTTIDTFPKRPIVATLPATNIASRSALVSGRVVSTGGDLPNTFFYYGTGNPTKDTNAVWQAIIVTGISTNLVSQTITNLNPGTKYYYMFGAVNADGVGIGMPVLSFTTITNVALTLRQPPH